MVHCNWLGLIEAGRQLTFREGGRGFHRKGFIIYCGGRGSGFYAEP